MGRKAREPLEKIKTRVWFNQLKVELNAESAGEVAVLVGDAKTSSRLRTEKDAAAIRKFERWQNGTTTPSRSDLLSIQIHIGAEKGNRARNRLAAAFDSGPHGIWPCMRLPCQVNDDPGKIARKEMDTPLYAPLPEDLLEALEHLESSTDGAVNYEAERFKNSIEIFMTAFERLLLAHRLGELSARRESRAIEIDPHNFYENVVSSYNDILTIGREIPLSYITLDQISSTILDQATHVGAEFYSYSLANAVRRELHKRGI